MPQTRFRVLYCDIGGVLGTNGWGGEARENVCRQFGLEPEEIADRHRLMFDSYERGFISFDDYLKLVFFPIEREFTLEQVRNAAFEQSVAWTENLEFFAQVKRLNHLKLGLISNEGQGITEHRVGKFKLRELADFMVISHCVHMRKPDPNIWRLALDLTQSRPEEAIYIDDRPLFAKIASEMGFTGIAHTSLTDTSSQLAELNLKVPV